MRGEIRRQRSEDRGQPTEVSRQGSAVSRQGTPSHPRPGPRPAPLSFGNIASTAALTFFVLSAASLVERRLGQTGMRILTRLMGLVLTAIAVQFILDGIKLSFGGSVPTI